MGWSRKQLGAGRRGGGVWVGVYTSDRRKIWATQETLRADLHHSGTKLLCFYQWWYQCRWWGLFVCFISWLLVCKRLGPHRLSTAPDFQVPGNGAEGGLPQALPGLLLLLLKMSFPEFKCLHNPGLNCKSFTMCLRSRSESLFLTIDNK